MLLEIRKATQNDTAMLAMLFDAYRKFYGQSSNLSAAFDFLEQRMTKQDSVIFLAITNSEAIGFVQLYPIFSSVQLKDAWLLNDLYVTDNARNKGVAEALLQQAKQFGEETTAAYIMLQTGSDNYKAQSVYEKNGWIKLPDFFYEYPL